MAKLDRIDRLEQNAAKLQESDAVMREQITSLVSATKDNTSAIRDLTTMLAYNRGIIVASAKFAGLVTMIIGAAWATGTWVVSFFHMGAK